MDASWRAAARRHRHRHGYLLLGAVGIALALIAAYLGGASLRRFLDNNAYDLLFAPADVAQSSATPVIVDIDEESLARFGQWPWPRYRVARLLDRIQAAGPRAVGIDMLFAEPDRTSLRAVQTELARELGVQLDLSQIASPLWDNDEALAKALASGPFLLSFQFHIQRATPSAEDCALHPLNVAVAHEGGSAATEVPLLQAAALTCSLPLLAGRAAGSGFFNATPDADGILRRLPLIVRHGDRFYPSLALAVLCRAHGIKQVRLSMRDGKIAALRAGTYRIPLDSAGQLLIRYRSRQPGFRYISAAKLLAGEADARELAERVVFVGTSAVGLLDHWPTPVAAMLNGVEVHATVVDNIQRGDLLSRPAWSWSLELGLTLLTGLLTAALLAQRRAVVGSLLLAGWGAVLWWGAHWSLNACGVFVSPMLPLLALAANFGLLTLFKFISEERRARRRTRELVLAQEFTIQSLAALAETRDSETGGHIYRVQRYVRTLCLQLKRHPKFKDLLDDGNIDLLYKSAPLHDIGKVGVPDRILRKQGKLSPDEFEEMKRHTIYGLQAIQRAEAHVESGSVSQFLHFAKEFTYTHHERWDGSGYPRGVAGEQIPLAGRLMSLADVYDALISRRIYKPAFDHQQAVAMIAEGSGTVFDPEILAAFLRVADQFQQIARELADESAQHPENPDSLLVRLPDGDARLA